MTGESFSFDDEDTSDDRPAHSGDEENTPPCCDLTHLFILGSGLAFAIPLVSLGIASLTEYVLAPIYHWAENLSIPLAIVFVLSLLAGSYVIGIINRFGVERISKTDLPNNRKWITLHGFIVALIGMILIWSFFGFSQMVESPESYWTGLVSSMIGTGIQLLCLLLVGLVGYLVAVKLPLFRNKSHSPVAVHSEAS